MKRAVLIDFDGTMTLMDTAVLVLDHFAVDEWRTYDQMLGEGSISLEECMSRQFEMVAATEREIIDFLDGHVKLRSGIHDFFMKAERSPCDLTIVSAGLRFYIEHVLERNGWDHRAKLITGIARHVDGHIKFEFPPIMNIQARDFKEDAVLSSKEGCDEVVYIGDGNSDFNAARRADRVLAVKDSRLADLCETEGLDFELFDDFYTIMDVFV